MPRTTSSKSSTGAKQGRGLVTGSSWVPPAAGHKRHHGEISLNENASKYNSCCISSCSNSSCRVVVVVKVEVVV